MKEEESHSTTGAMDVRGIVTHLRDLASDPRNRATIVRDQGCLPGLVLFLDNPDADVVETALETLLFLASCDDNKGIMTEELGLLVSIKDIAASTTASSFMQDIAKAIMDCLQPAPRVPEEGPAENVESSSSAKSANNDEENTPGTPAHGSFFIGNMNKTARTVTLQVNGMDSLANRKMIEEKLLGVKGVVSFTFDMEMTRVIIRARMAVTAEMLCKCIASTKVMEASQIVRNNAGEEVVLSFGNTKTQPTLHDKENGGATTGAATPKKSIYLDDEDDDTPIAPVHDKALAPFGQVSKKVSGWLTGAAGYLSKSLYW